MTKKVRTAVQSRIGRQSGFLSPVLTVFLLAVASMLPKERETKKLSADEVKQLRPTIKASDCKVTLADGTQLAVAQLPAIEENADLERHRREGYQRMAAAFDVPGSAFQEEQGYVGRDSYGRYAAIRMAPAYDLPASWRGEDLQSILGRYFANNPFYQYGPFARVEVERIRHGVEVYGVDYQLGRQLIGTIDFVRERVGFADPETGLVDQSVPLAVAPPRTSEWAVRDMNMGFGYADGYCTPSRRPMTGRIERTAAPRCDCQGCREHRRLNGPVESGCQL